MDDQSPHVVEIIRRIREGSTEPFLCRCDDGFMYVVKSMPTMPRRQLVAEFISACLVRDIGLPFPEFTIVYVPEELLEFSPDLRKQIEAGYAFASRYIENAVSLSFAQSRNNDIIPLNDQKMIYVFDRWIINVDRTLTDKGGNINMLLDVKDNRYYLIDHNLAFDQNATLRDFNEHVFSHLTRNWEIDMVDRLAHREMLLKTYRKMPDFW